MSAPPMRTPRSRPPGFASTRTEASGGDVVAAETATAAASDSDSATRQNGRAETPRRHTTRPPRQAATNRQPTASPAAAKPAASQDCGYAGAATRQFNTRLLEPLHRRYTRLVRDLADEGYETSMTELVHALLHEGPTTTTEARARIRAWRQLRAAE